MNLLLFFVFLTFFLYICIIKIFCHMLEKLYKRNVNGTINEWDYVSK